MFLEKTRKTPEEVQLSFFDRVGVEMRDIVADAQDDRQILNEFGTVKLKL
jgi:hypothetical protein